MRYFVESYGCTMNFGEGRILSEHMASLGHVEAPSADEADIVIVNTCTVVETTEKKMVSRISELKKMGKEVIVTGCMAKVQPQRILVRLPSSIILPPREYGSFPDLVASKYGVAGPPVEVKGTSDAIIPIAQGCLGNCTYCITKHARGKLSSYPAESVMEHFDNALKSGAKEILVTAQDTACYGFDTGTGLPALLSRMLEREGDFRIRIGMMNPKGLARISNGLAEAMEDGRVYRFLHVPVQSGSDAVLSAMRRGYTVQEFESVIKMFREKVPDVSIATDVITGFPGETEEDHEATKALVERLEADTLNITRFSPRPGTEAKDMPQIHGGVSKRRSTELTDLKNRVEYGVNSRMVGKTFSALATEWKEGTVLRTDCYRPVVVPEKIQLGARVEVEIVDCRSTYLIGRLTTDNSL